MDNRNRNTNTDPTNNPGEEQGSRKLSVSEKGFEGMNFEEQRSSIKNSDGAGAKGSGKGSRNGITPKEDKK